MIALAIHITFVITTCKYLKQNTLIYLQHVPPVVKKSFFLLKITSATLQ